jgi:hypothetical protein
MTLQLSSLTIESNDPAALAGFWSSVAGGEPTGSATDVFLQPDALNGVRLHFRHTTASRSTDQVTHLDFRVDWSRREAEVERLLELGAVRRWDIIDQFPGMRWTTLADPEGNLFCITEVKPR